MEQLTAGLRAWPSPRPEHFYLTTPASNAVGMSHMRKEALTTMCCSHLAMPSMFVAKQRDGAICSAGVFVRTSDCRVITVLANIAFFR